MAPAVDELHGTLFYGDNLAVLRERVPNACVDLVYLDPPFNSNASYSVLFRDESGRASGEQIEAFDDTWHWGANSEAALAELLAAAPAAEHMTVGGGGVGTLLEALVKSFGRNQLTAYLAMMAIRLVELRRVLKPDGSIYLHCDPTAGHYLRMLMDAVFGADFWQAQITWKRTSAHSDSSTFGSVCDLLLFYGGREVNTDDVRVPLDPEYVARHYRFSDERGQHRHSDLSGPLHNQKRGVPSTEPWRGYDVFAAGRCWSVPRKGAYAEFIDRELIPGYRGIESIHERLDALADADLIYWPKKPGGMPHLKRYLHANPGQAISNLWDDIPPLSKHATEATGFDTQKPLALLKRIIQASSNEGDLVLDPFCGCGTAVVAAHELNRRWVGIDITHLAVGLMEQRLHALAAEPRVIGAPTSLAAARDLAKRSRFQFETWAVTRIEGFRPNARQVGDGGIDGRMRFVKSESDGKTEYGLAVAQVKSGGVSRNDVDAFRTALEREGADLGVFLTLEPPGPRHGAWAEAKRAGVVEISGRGYDRIQVWSIADHFAGRRPELPAALMQVSRRLL